MQRLMTRASVFAFASLLLGSAACGPKPAGKVPVSSPVYSFVAPDAEDFAPDTDDDDDSGTSSEPGADGTDAE
jgi:hypothetical protein